MNDDLKMPTVPEDESGIIGCCILGGVDTVQKAFDVGVRPESFDNLLFGRTFQSMLDLMKRELPVNGETVGLELIKRDPDLDFMAVTRTEDHVPSAENLSYYLPPFLDRAARRDWIRRCRESARLAADTETPFAMAQGALEGVEVSAELDGRIINAKPLVESLIDDLERREALDGKLPGIATGFDDFDHMTGGLHQRELAIIGARPSVGKTALAVAWTLDALFAEVPTCFVSLEMNHDAILRRMASAACLIPQHDLKMGNIKGHMKRLMEFNTRISKSPFHFVDGVNGLSIDQIAEDVRQLVKRHGVQLVIVDYLQKIRPASKHEKRTYEVGAVSQELKALADTTNTAVVALAQLNRAPDQDKGRMPRLSDLADSSQLERDGDMIALLHRPRDEGSQNGKLAKLIIGKQRDGEVGIIDLLFRAEFVKFENPAIDIWKNAA